MSTHGLDIRATSGRRLSRGRLSYRWRGADGHQTQGLVMKAFTVLVVVPLRPRWGSCFAGYSPWEGSIIRCRGRSGCRWPRRPVLIKAPPSRMPRGLTCRRC